MEHLGQIQSGGKESGQPWVRARANLSEQEVVFYVGDTEVERIARAEDTFEFNGTIYKVHGADQPLFFHPDDAERFKRDIKGAITGTDRIAAAAAVTQEQQPRLSSPTRPLKSRTTAAVLAIFLGGLGIHRFYLGDTGLGLIYLLFSWTLIPALVGLIEGIVFLTKSDEDFARQYG
jgi:TM2 domain-containing membrane protein YozV